MRVNDWKIEAIQKCEVRNPSQQQQQPDDHGQSFTDSALLVAGRWLLSEAGLAQIQGELHSRGADWMGPAPDHLISWRSFQHLDTRQLI